MSTKTANYKSAAKAKGDDLEADRRKRVTPRPHPPRLQHSPSLPNIWFLPFPFSSLPRSFPLTMPNRFPPHSGPIPPQLADIRRDQIHLLSSLPPMNTKLKNTDDDETPKSTYRPRVSLTKLQDTRRARAESSNAQPHPLLTPPLTPSSSIRTTASIESVKSNNTVITDSDYDGTLQTRFLQISNLSTDVPKDLLNGVISNVFTARNLRPFLPQAGSIPSHGPPHASEAAKDIIKGVYFRDHQTRGYVIVAFFDIRYACAANRFLSINSTNPLRKYANVKAEGHEGSAIKSQFFTMKALVEMIGDSEFLTVALSGAFFLGVECESGCDDDISSSPSNEQGREERNATVLKNMLMAHGDLFSFGLVKEGSSSTHSTVYRIEYYDARDSDRACNALDCSIHFGMKLKVLGRDRLQSQLPCNYISLLSPDTPELGLRLREVSLEEVQYPSLHHPAPVDDIPAQAPLAPPGLHSHVREQYVFPPCGTPNGLDDPVPGSPAFFYASSPSAAQSRVEEREDHLDGDAADSPVLTNPLAPNSGSESSIPNDGPTRSLRPFQFGNGYCYPSQDGDGQACYAYCSSPPPVSYVPPSHPSYPISSPPPPIGGFAYEYGSPPGMPWHSLPAAWFYGNKVAHGGAPCLPEFWRPPMSESYQFDQGPSASPVSEQPSSESLSHSGPGLRFPSVARDEASGRPFRKIHSRDRSLPLSPSLSRGAPREPVPIPKGNELNLDKIEKGQDTRTTVMIKNIPNKMSDKDLQAFIGKVCPRRIDFLYLRMDFNNRCNFGYAFVNFIEVKDLLGFAKNMLGKKWNMFSSEKVLQMSYANVQGKEALVEKFKNSCIMDEQDSWKPKIFYSEPGPDQGLLEPFPAPTHLGRKERSVHNRGTLYALSGAVHRSSSPHRRGTGHRHRATASDALGAFERKSARTQH